MAQRVIASLAAAGLVVGAAVTAGLVIADVPSSDHSETLPVLPSGSIGGGGAGVAAGNQSFSSESKMVAPSAAADAAISIDDGRYWVPPILNYIVDADVSALGGKATVWQFPTGVAPDPTRINALAEALGVKGELKSTDYGWEIVDGDRTVSVSNDALGSWWYSAPSPDMWVCAATSSVGSAEPAAEGDDVLVDPAVVTDCPEPEPPTGLPAAADAEREARKLFAAAGFDDLAVTVNAYEWSVDVSGIASYGNVPGDIGFYVGFGQDAAITYAGGHLNRPVEVGEYPLVDGATAVQRLKDGAANGPMPLMAKTEPAVLDVAPADGDTVVSSDDAVAVNGGEAIALPAPDIAIQCVTEPCEPAEPEVIDIRLTGVSQVLTQWWASDGSVWLIPAYRFTDADGGWYPVLAVTDEYLPAEPEPVPVPEPAPVPDPVCGDPATNCETDVTIEPRPAPAPAVEGEAPAAVGGSEAVPPSTEPPVTEPATTP